MTITPETTTIGFIGTGVMGASMAANLMKAGYRLNVYSRTREKAQALVDAGAAWLDSAGDVASQSDVVITIVGLPSDVEEVYLAPGGIVEWARPGAYLIDMTTSSPTLAKRVYEQASERGLHALDAPVSGGDVGARDGTLVIMAGGEEADFEAVQPVFDVLGKSAVLHGSAGTGQHAKMCNQIAIATNMIGVAEAVVYAKRAGLDPERVLSSITGGAAGSWSLSNLAPRIIRGDFGPGFYIQHFVKDLKIALDMAADLGLDLPGVQLSESMYESLLDRGEAFSGTQALYKYYEQA